jgi:hypothetical protein
MLASSISDASAQSGERAISIGVTMIRRPHQFFTTLLGVGCTGILLAGCAGATPASPTPSSPTIRPTATRAASLVSSPSVSAAPSDSPSPTENLGLPHVNAALEDKLPGIIGGIQLEKFSWPLSTYVASLKGTGDSALYTPWLVKFGKTTGDVDMAVAADLTQTENFVAHAIEVPGVDAAALNGGFADEARKDKWPVSPKQVGPKNVLEIIDPVTTAAGGLGTAYVYAQGDVLYVVVTDDPALLLEALIKLP